jgi:hypothetical protein
MLPVTPLVEAGRVLLMESYVGEVRGWKSDDAAETVVLAVRDPRRDTDDLSFFKATKQQLLTGQLDYLGTTTRGKDGGYQVLIFNDGTVVVLLTESPKQLDPGALNALYAITLQQRTGASIAQAGPRGPAGPPGPQGPSGTDAVRALAADLVTAASKHD